MKLVNVIEYHITADVGDAGSKAGSCPELIRLDGSHVVAYTIYSVMQ